MHGNVTRVDAGSRLVRVVKRLPIALPAVVLFCALISPLASATDSATPTTQASNLWLLTSAQTVRLHAAHRQPATDVAPSLIQQVRFNERTLPFHGGFIAGPGLGDLDIQFAPASSTDFDRLRYRLLGFDAEWKEAGKEREVIYARLPPGRYQLDLQEVESRRGRTSAVESIPILMVPAYWQTRQFRSVCTVFLLVLILALYKLRVSGLVRRTKRLEDSVNRTKLELNLAAKIASDAQQALKEQALKDSLTGLWNRRAIFSMLENEVCRAQRDGLPITLVMIDMDHFKNINDTHGHLIGDAVLREAAGRLFQVMRPYDFAGRYGGEEFLAVLPSCSERNGILRAEDFRRAIADHPIPTVLGPLAVTCSLGVAAFDLATSSEEMIHRADEALYRAKRMGRNQVCAGTWSETAHRN